MSRKIYILSEIADKDLEDIFDYTFDEFGFDQAEKYLLEIEEIFQKFNYKSINRKKTRRYKTRFI